MSKHVRIILQLCLAIVVAGSLQAADLGEYNSLSRMVDSAIVTEVNVFAPKVFEKAFEEFQKAKKAVDDNKKQKDIDKYTDKSREYLDNALKAADVAKLSLEQYLEPRRKARTAKAYSIVPLLYDKAEGQFLKATEKVESGNVKDGLKEAAQASPLFDQAELEAIRKEILDPADKLIFEAEKDDAVKYAPSTLDKARSARARADAIITQNRYNRADAMKEEKLAEYEARHASNIALSVRSLNRNDQAWEKLMLGYEIQMNRVGKEIDFVHLPFDEGPAAAADTLISYITDLQKYNSRLEGKADDLTTGVSTTLRDILSAIGEPSAAKDPVKLAEQVGQHTTRLLEERNKLQETVTRSDEKMAVLAEQHGAVQARLDQRKAAEDRIQSAKMILNPSEGEVLMNSSNDIVLRLSGLSFDIGKSEVKDQHIALLAKVQKIMKLFPDAPCVVEGHTDASGESVSNRALSEKRAFAVMQYLRQEMQIPADKIKAVGYGSERPIASNQTSEGRAKNRRIDLLIMQ